MNGSGAHEKQLVTTALSLRKICKAYAAPVLVDIDLELHAGEVHALVGANGAGKSTLARIICGLARPDSGEMELHADHYAPAIKADAEAAGVHVVQQELNVLPTLTVAENLFLNRLPSTGGFVRRRVLQQRARKALDAVELHSVVPEQLVSSLGIGQQQMVEIASALSRTLRVLILDEPTAALTAPEVDVLFTRIRALKLAGVAIIYISHRMEEICSIADRVSVLRDGRIVDTRAAADATIDSMVSLMAGTTGAGKSVGNQPAAEPVKSNAPVIFRVDRLCGGPLVQDITFEVRRGEILGIAGLVGSGRTETLRCIYGADTQRSGVVSIGDPLRHLSIRSPRDAVRAGIGLLPEDRKSQGLLLTESIRANISLARIAAVSRAGWMSRRRERDIAEKHIQQLAIACSGVEQPTARLSGGNQQKVLLARWLLRDTQVLLLDEPTRGIDISARNTIYNLLHELATAGKTLVVVSSDLLELMQLCDRIAVMSAGRIAGTFPRSDWDEERIMAAAFSGYSGSRQR